MTDEDDSRDEQFSVDANPENYSEENQTAEQSDQNNTSSEEKADCQSAILCKC